MPTVYMLVGVPGSGKSTWLTNNVRQNGNDAVWSLSTDDYIEDIARQEGKTYNDVFKDHIKDATAHMYDELKIALGEKADLYWDQTNLSVKSRKGKIAQVPKDYTKIAVVFKIPDRDELMLRLNSRPGKTIPDHVMNSMIKNFEMPTQDEGFDGIIEV